MGFKVASSPHTSTVVYKISFVQVILSTVDQHGNTKTEKASKHLNKMEERKEKKHRQKKIGATLWTFYLKSDVPQKLLFGEK